MAEDHGPSVKDDEQDLYDEAKQVGIDGRSNRSRSELVDALRRH